MARAKRRALTVTTHDKWNSADSNRASAGGKGAADRKPTSLICAERTFWRAVGPTFFRSGARGRHVPARLTTDATKHEARKRRANERPRVACCEELAGRPLRADRELLLVSELSASAAEIRV